MYKLPGFGTLSGRSTSAFSTLNTTALAPMASARVITAVTANPGYLRNWRRASLISAFMLPPPVTRNESPAPNLGSGDRAALTIRKAGFWFKESRTRLCGDASRPYEWTFHLVDSAASFSLIVASGARAGLVAERGTAADKALIDKAIRFAFVSTLSTF